MFLRLLWRILLGLFKCYQSSEVKNVVNVTDKKELVLPLSFHYGMWDSVILTGGGSSSQLVLISLSLSLHTAAFTGLSDYSQILQPVTNLQLTKCC